MKRRGFLQRAGAFFGGAAVSANVMPAKAARPVDDAIPHHAALRYSWIDDNGKLVDYEAAYNPDGTVLVSGSPDTDYEAIRKAASEDFEFDVVHSVVRWRGTSDRVHHVNALYSYSCDVFCEPNMMQYSVPFIALSVTMVRMAYGWTIEPEALVHIAGVVLPEEQS